jgi:hypothetical protein
MKGQEVGLIRHAVQQAQMQTNFLILLINRTNSVVLLDSRVSGCRSPCFMHRYGMQARR